MNKHYHGQLQIEANVPNHKIINDLIKLTVTFEILCPNCGPNNKNIKKNGHDKKSKENPQIYFCKTCKKCFFPHTSWIFKEFSDLVVENVLDDLFVEGISPKAISKKLHVSSSFVTNIRYQCFNLLKQKIDIIRSEADFGKKLTDLPLVTQSGIWWDETFFKINGQTYFLILIIDALGRVLAYKFAKSRGVIDYTDLLIPILDKLPETPVFICDGAPAYEGVIKSLNRSCFLIQHIHSHPWNQVKLHRFIFEDNSPNIEQTTIILPYDAFLRDEPVEIFSATKIVQNQEGSPIKKRRGRKKGSKDKKKRKKYGTRKVGVQENNKKKRGRKNLETVGAKLSFNPDPYKNGWNIKLLSNASKKHNLKTPDLENLKIILHVTFEIMNGGAIKSNLIESKNSNVKIYIQTLGLKNIYQADYLLGANLYARGDMEECPWNEDITNYSVRTTLGFNNMLMFFSPDISKIEVN